MSETTPPSGPSPTPPNQPQPSTPQTPPPIGAGDTSYLDWPFVKMFTQAGAPPPTRDEAIKMINQAIKNMLSDEIERSNRIHKETMQKMKEDIEDQ